MALAPTGSHVETSSSHLPPEKCCPEGEEVSLDYSNAFQLLQEISLTQAQQGDVPVEHNAVSLESSSNLLDQVQCLASGLSVPSPFSDTSSDSGILGSANSTEEEVFLAGLFGSDFSLMQCTSLDAYSPTPSPPDQSVSSPTECLHPVPSMSSKQNSRASTSGTAAGRLDSVAEKNRKNAEAARQNRIKKKKYMEGLEKERASLKRDNVLLKTKCHEYQTKCQRLQSEVDYLRSVLANDSVLASLIQNIPDVPGVNLTSSFRKRPSDDSNSSSSQGVAKRPRVASTGGVCLHVAKNVVSLEFCENCSKLAVSSS